MSEKNEIVWIIVACLAIFLILAGVFFIMTTVYSSTNAPKTIELTVEDVWGEGSKYYFADSNGFVYEIGNQRNIGEMILYEDMPKQRFEKLKKGNAYECVYLLGSPMRFSISEKEIENDD